LVIQTDWWPQAEHGALYELLGDDYSVDANNNIVSGSLVAGGEPTGIDLEVRAGGAAIGFQPVPALMALDDGLHLGYAYTETAAMQIDSAPMLSVVAPLEVAPNMIMWDPETYPDVETLADLGELGITILIFGGGTQADGMVARGLWSPDQIDPSYDGSPARFIAEDGAIAQQGFASAEPYIYEFELEDWGKPVAFELMFDAGFESYAATIGIRPDRLEELRPCLEQIVPIVQQAVVDFAGSPDRANAIIIDTVEQYDSFWHYSAGEAEWSVAKQLELGIIGNGPDDIVGNFDEARLERMLAQMRADGVEFRDDVVPSDLYTNEFIDESIGL